MTVNITAQTVCFMGKDFSLETILADSGIQTAIVNSLGNDVIVEYKQYYTFTVTPTHNWALLLTFFVTAGVANGIIAGIPDLVARMATAQPQITRIVTWGAARGMN